MKKLILGLIIASTANFSVKSNEFDAKFYKSFLNDYYKVTNSESFKDFMNIEDLDISNENFANDCIKNNTSFEKTTCFQITGQTGIEEGFMGYADYHFNKYLNSDNSNDKIKNIVFASKIYGLAEGFKNIPLVNEDSEFESEIQTFGDFLENPNLKVNDLNPLVDFHMSGVIDSLVFPINNYLMLDNVDFFNKEFFDIDESNITEKELPVFIEDLITGVEDSTTKTFLKLNNNEDKIVNILDSLYYGKNNLETNKNDSLNYLYNLGFQENNIEALKNLQLIFYREVKLNNKLKTEKKENYIDNILKISAKIYNLDKDNENVIVTNIIDEFGGEKSKIIDYVQKYII